MWLSWGFDKKKKGKLEIEIGEKKTNLRLVENTVIEGLAMADYEIEVVTWEKLLQEHLERIEKETRERQERIRKKKLKKRAGHQ